MRQIQYYHLHEDYSYIYLYCSPLCAVTVEIKATPRLVTERGIYYITEEFTVHSDNIQSEDGIMHIGRETIRVGTNGNQYFCASKLAEDSLQRI